MGFGTIVVVVGTSVVGFVSIAVVFCIAMVIGSWDVEGSLVVVV